MKREALPGHEYIEGIGQQFSKIEIESKQSEKIEAAEQTVEQERNLAEVKADFVEQSSDIAEQYTQETDSLKEQFSANHPEHEFSAESSQKLEALDKDMKEATSEFQQELAQIEQETEEQKSNEQEPATEQIDEEAAEIRAHNETTDSESEEQAEDSEDEEAVSVEAITPSNQEAASSQAEVMDVSEKAGDGEGERVKAMSEQNGSEESRLELSSASEQESKVVETGGFDQEQSESKEEAENILTATHQQLSNRWQKLMTLANTPDAKPEQLKELAEEVTNLVRNKELGDYLDKEGRREDVEAVSDLLVSFKSELGKFNIPKELSKDSQRQLEQSLDIMYGAVQGAIKNTDELYYDKKVAEGREMEAKLDAEQLKGELPQRFENLDLAIRSISNTVREQHENGFAAGLNSDQLSGSLYKLRESLGASNPDSESIASAINSLSESIAENGESGLPLRNIDEYLESVGTLSRNLGLVRDAVLQLKHSKLVEGQDGEKILKSLHNLEDAAERKWLQQSKLRDRIENYLSGGY